MNLATEDLLTREQKVGKTIAKELRGVCSHYYDVDSKCNTHISSPLLDVKGLIRTAMSRSMNMPYITFTEKIKLASHVRDFISLTSRRCVALGILMKGGSILRVDAYFIHDKVFREILLFKIGQHRYTNDEILYHCMSDLIAACDM